VLIVLVLCILTTFSVVVFVRRRRAAGDHPDLGWVSERWLQEYRADSTRPSH
jgi:hypothetical protein